MRKLVTKSANGASLRADFDEALRMVQLRGLSGEAKRAASITLRQPAPRHPTDWLESPTRQSRARNGLLFYSAITAKGDNSATPSSCRPAHKRRISLHSKPSLTGNG